MSMTLYQLKSFVTVAKLGSFTLAAEALKVRQPSATLIIQNLERELDIKLFERLGNKIHLTNAGQELLREAEPIVTRAEGIKEKMEEVRGLKKGRLAVGGASMAAASYLPLIVQAFREKYPGVEVFVKIQRSNTLEKELLDGELDLAILSRNPRSTLVTAEPYLEEKIVVIAPPDHPFARRRVVSLELLSKEPLIVQEKGTGMREMIEKEFDRKGLSFKARMEVDVQFGARDIIKSAVASGLGIGFLFQSHVKWDVKAGRIKVLRVPDLKEKRITFIGVHKNRQASSLTQAFKSLLNESKGMEE